MNLFTPFSILILVLVITNVESSIPDSFDWREEGAVTGVRNQGNCTHGDWAFAATGALEAKLFQSDRNLTELSKKELIDCSGEFGNVGCDGGDVKKALRYIEAHGIASEQTYPYSEKDSTCLLPRDRIVNGSKIILKNIHKGDENWMKYAIYAKGPLLAVVDSPKSFREYKGGVYDDSSCTENGKDPINVLIVGYNVTERAQEYWIVKNSWGESWGDKGYIKIARNKNMCGIASKAHSLEMQPFK